MRTEPVATYNYDQESKLMVVEYENGEVTKFENIPQSIYEMFHRCEMTRHALAKLRKEIT